MTGAEIDDAPAAEQPPDTPRHLPGLVQLLARQTAGMAHRARHPIEQRVAGKRPRSRSVSRPFDEREKTRWFIADAELCGGKRSADFGFQGFPALRNPSSPRRSRGSGERHGDETERSGLISRPSRTDRPTRPVLLGSAIAGPPRV